LLQFQKRNKFAEDSALDNRKTTAIVAVEATTYTIDKPYEYTVPDELLATLAPGVRVRVGFGKGNRRTEAIVLELRELSGLQERSLKPIIEQIDDLPVLDEKQIKLALWLREQCFCTFFDVARAMLPAGVWHKFDVAYIPVDVSKVESAFEIVSGIECAKEIVQCIFNANKPCRQRDLVEIYGEVCVKKTIDVLLKEGAVLIYEYVTRNISDKTERLVRLGVSKEDVSEYIVRKKVKPTVREALELLCNVGAVSSKELCYFTGISPAQINTLKKNGIVYYESVEVYRRPRPTVSSNKREIVLNDKQQQVFESIATELGKGPSCSLIHGVTGSGKTLVYFKLIEKAILMGKTAILLVPEISLTPQLLAQVYAYFGERTAVMHSALSTGERYDEWKRIRNGEVDVVVGTRSAIFSPVKNIGIIILDEEQEDTYKSSSNPRYHARDAAKFRAVSENAMLLLGSATPSVESMYNAKIGKYKLYTLTERFNEQPLPRVIISDLRKSLRNGTERVIGNELYEELVKNIESGEQSILFINRRGASKYAICDECGEVPGCPNCSVPLVYHSRNLRLMCHHCGYSERVESKCSQCGGRIKFVGFGTQRVEEELNELFPGIKTVRMDMDTTSGKASHEKLLNKFRDEKIPILLGTQMITKGLDFENVTLVGVLSADQSIFNENYKASENAFSLITQVVGRSGRGEKSGRAVIQTYSPNNALIRFAAAQDYNAFFDNELMMRECRKLPPFSDMFSLTVLAESEIAALNACSRLRDKVKQVLASEYSELEMKVLGPSPASIVKINGKYRYKIVLLTENNKRVRDLISRLLRDFMKDKKNKNMSIIPDINSTDF